MSSMNIARIQFLTKTDLGWHIRFTGILDTGFQTTLERFKEEQRKSAKINCRWDSTFFNGKGGWFITERILLKYQDYFENYAAMRRGAEVAYNLEHQEDLWGETKSEREQQQDEEKRQEAKLKAEEEARAKEKQRWNSSFHDHTYAWEASWAFDDTAEKEAKQKQEESRARWDRARETYKEREREWEQFDREQQSRPPARPTSTGLTLSEALIELGFSALAHPTEIEVKKAFRQLAMVKHPDHGGDHLAFIKLNKAYQLVLWSVQGVKA